MSWRTSCTCSATSYTGNSELKLKVTGTDSTKYRYDTFGNLRDVYLPSGDQIEYVIDAQLRRIGRKWNGTLQKGWLYQSQLAIAAEVDASGAVTKTFEYATHGNVADWMQANGTVYRIVTDHLGSVRLVVDVNGTVAQRIDYDAYGRVLTNTNPGFQPFGYAGGLLDDATGLTRFGARDYDAEVGGWTTRDPIGFSDDQSSLYAYAAGSPVTATDPSGLCTGEQARCRVGALAATRADTWDRPEFRAQALRLFRLSQMDHRERTAYLYGGPNGEVVFGKWDRGEPEEGRVRRSLSSVPPNAIGAIHTHPDAPGATPGGTPSGADAQMSMQSRLPEFVISRIGFSVVPCQNFFYSLAILNLRPRGTP